MHISLKCHGCDEVFEYPVEKLSASGLTHTCGSSDIDFYDAEPLDLAFESLLTPKFETAEQYALNSMGRRNRKIHTMGSKTAEIEVLYDFLRDDPVDGIPQVIHGRVSKEDAARYLRESEEINRTLGLETNYFIRPSDDQTADNPEYVPRDDERTAHHRWRVQAKVKEIAEGIQSTNPSISIVAAINLAKQTIERYPAVVKQR